MGGLDNAASARLDDILARIDEFRESDHPRDNDGKFSTSGGGGSSAPTKAAAPVVKATASSATKEAKLTPTEKSYVSSYSGDQFLRVNTELRSGNASDSSIKPIDSAIDKSPLKAGTELYRGLPMDAAKQLFGGEPKAGQTISDPAFASTTRKEEKAWHRMGGVVLKITANEGAKGLDMKGLSRNEAEEEVLLPRNAKMLVTGVTKPKNVWEPIIVRVIY